jgi:hypothetical protein
VNEALQNNFSAAEKRVILQSIDFSSAVNQNAFTPEQRADLGL